MDDDRPIHTLLMDTMTRMAESIDNDDMTFNEVERKFEDADGRKCGIWDQDVTLFTVIATIIPDPDYLNVALNN